LSFYGTSLRSIYNLAKSRGYAFLGTNSAGNNAYFVKENLLSNIRLNELSIEEGYTFSSFSESWDKYGKPCRGAEKVMALDGLSVFNTEKFTIESFDAKTVCEQLLKSGKLSRA
jgi:hypothetical protein